MMHYKGLAKLAAKEAKNRALLICETAGVLSLLGEKWAYSAQVESLQQSDGRELLAEIVRMVGRIPTEEAVTVRGSMEQHAMLDVTLARLGEAMQVDGPREVKATPLMYGSTMLWQTRDRQIIGLPEDAQAAVTMTTTATTDAQLRGVVVDIVVDPCKKAIDAGQIRVARLYIDAGVRQVQQQVDRQDVGVLHVLCLGKKHLGHVVVDGVDDAAAPPGPAGRQLRRHGCGIQFASAAGVSKVGVCGIDRQRAVARPRQTVLTVCGRAAIKLLIGIRVAAQPLAQQRQRGFTITHLYRLPRHSPHCFASSRRTYGGHSRLPEIHPCSVRSGIANRAAKSVCDRPVCCTISLTVRCA